jgi:hypothetical protein
MNMPVNYIHYEAAYCAGFSSLFIFSFLHPKILNTDPCIELA